MTAYSRCRLEISLGTAAGVSAFHSGLDEVSAIRKAGAAPGAFSAAAMAGMSRENQRPASALLGGVTKLARSGLRSTPVTSTGVWSAGSTAGRAEMVSPTKPRSTRITAAPPSTRQAEIRREPAWPSLRP